MKPLHFFFARQVLPPTPKCCAEEICFGIDNACWNNHLGCLKYYFEQEMQRTCDSLFWNTLEGGRRNKRSSVKCFRYAMVNNFPAPETGLMHLVASYGNVDILQMVHTKPLYNKVDSKYELLKAAICQGRSLPCVKFIVENNLHEWSKISVQDGRYADTVSAEDTIIGNILLVGPRFDDQRSRYEKKLLQYVLQQGCPWYPQILSLVISSLEHDTNYNMIEDVLELGCRDVVPFPTAAVFESVAKKQCLDLLKYPRLREAIRTKFVLSDSVNSCDYLKELLKKADEHLAAAKAAIEDESGLPQDVVKHVVMGFL